MALIDDFENHLARQYNTVRSSIQDAERLSVTHLDQRVTIDFFTTGKIKSSGKACPVKEKVDEVIARVKEDPGFFASVSTANSSLTPKEAILKVITWGLYGFLPEHDRDALLAAYQLILAGIALPDFSPVTMPVSRVYEGFLARLLVRLGLCTQIVLETPNFKFEAVFDSNDAKSFRGRVATHGGELDAAKQRLKEFRHLQLHSQSSQFLRFKTLDEARRFVERVLNDMQSFFDYFNKYFTKE